jgi:hypothetical protein
MQRRVHGAWERATPFGEPDIGSVGIAEQKSCQDERVQNDRTHWLGDSAQALDLLSGQFHPGHFQVLGADTLEHSLINEHIHDYPARLQAEEELAASRNSHSAFNPGR